MVFLYFIFPLMSRFVSLFPFYAKTLYNMIKEIYLFTIFVGFSNNIKWKDDYFFFSEWKIDYGICIFMCIIWYSECIYVYIIAKYVYGTNIFMYSTFCPFIFFLHSVFIFSSSIFGFLCKLSRILIHITDFLQYYFNTINLLFLFWILRLRL